MYSLEEALAKDEPAFQFYWRPLVFREPEGLNLGIANNPKEWFESCDLPFPQMGIKPAVQMGQRYNFVEMMEVPTFNAVLYETHQWRVTEAMSRWAGYIRDRDTGLYRVKSKIAASMTIGLLNKMGDVVLHARLIGMIPTTAAQIPLSGEGGRVTFSQEFSIDNVFIDPA